MTYHLLRLVKNFPSNSFSKLRLSKKLKFFSIFDEKKKKKIKNSRALISLLSPKN